MGKQLEVFVVLTENREQVSLTVSGVYSAKDDDLRDILTYVDLDDIDNLVVSRETLYYKEEEEDE